MQPGSLVARTTNVDPREIAEAAGLGIYIPTKDEVLVVKDGPKLGAWPNRPTISCILLEEYPKNWYNAEYFSELQRPVSSEELVEILHQIPDCELA